MRFIKRCLSVVVAAAVIAAGIPMAFYVMGEEADIIKLSTLQNFSGSTEEIKVSSGGSFSLVNSGAAGGGKAVKVNTSGASSWTLVELSVPLSDTEVGAAKGLLIYTEWNDNLNCYISVSGSNSEGPFSTAPKQWKNPPVFDAASGKWIATDAAGNPGSIALKHNFKGYIYLPFSILDTVLTPDTVIDTVTFKGFNTDSHTPYTVGSIYLVENDVLPADYYGSPQYPSDVELDGQAVSLIRKLELSTFESFKDGEIKYSVTSGANLEVMSGTRAIGGGNTLKVEASAIGEWQTATVTFPADIDVSTAKGLFVYVQWGGNRNCFITVEGIKDGKNVYGSFEQWTHSIPLYDTLADEWIPSPESNNPGAMFVPEMFEGYIYVPFDKIIPGGIEKLTAFKIGGMNTDSIFEYYIGGIYIVNNDVLPVSYTDGLSNDVILDGQLCSLSNKPFNPDDLIAEYLEQIEAVKIDGEFYKQTDKDALLESLEELKAALEKAETSNEQQALISDFDVLFDNFIKGPEADISFAIISDVHLNGSNERTARLSKFLEDVKIASPEAKAVLVAGDLTDNGSEAEFEAYWNIIKNNTPDGTTVLSAMGNHDARGDFMSGASEETRWEFAKERYLTGLNNYLGTNFTDTYYHMEIGGYDFIVLNTENADKDTATISPEQQEWFKNKLDSISKAKPGSPIFVMLHQPLTATHPGTTALESTVGASGKAIKAIVADYPQVIFMSGHIHNGVGYSDIINDGKGIFLDLPSIYANGTGNTSVTLAYYVSVHDNIVRFRVRDFQTGAWLAEYEEITEITGISPVNKDELRKAYYLYRATGRGRYSEESWNAFSSALENAHNVLKDVSKTQDEIDRALESLESAVKGLVIEPIKLAADNEPMEISILQDYENFDISKLNSDFAKAELKDGSRAIDIKKYLETSAISGEVTFKIPFSQSGNLNDANAIMVYLKLPAASDGKTSFRIKPQLLNGDNAINISGTTFTYLDNTSQSWFSCQPDANGDYSMPTGFEGYIRLSFGNLDENRIDEIRAADCFAVSYTASDKTVAVGGIYSVIKDTAGITAIVQGKAVRYLENGKEPTEDQKELFKASMKAETLHSFKGYKAGDSAVGDLVTLTGVNKNDITVKYTDSITGIISEKALEIDAPTIHSFWPGENVTEEYAYVNVKYPENTYLNDMAALMFYVETSESNPTSEDPFTTKVFFDMHTLGPNGGGVWSNTGSYETLYFLEAGTTEWQRLESDTGHILLPTGVKGFVLAPIDSFSVNPISTTLEGRKLIDTTFIFSGFGGDMGAVKISGIWSVLDMGTNNLLMSYNGAEIWNLSNEKEAVIGDLNSGTQFPDKEELIDELPSSTVSDYEIHEPAYEDVTDKEVTLSWDAFPDAASYNVRIYKTVYSGTGIKYKVVSEKNTEETVATLGGLEPLTWYYAVVEALDADGDIIAIYPNLLFQSADAEYDYDFGDEDDIPGENPVVPILGENGSVMVWSSLLAAAFVILAVSHMAIIRTAKRNRASRR